jgi:4-hydroxythreonine-4-phosphate dehydrogenase
MHNKKLIGITIGDPAGIGPEISLKVSQDKEIVDLCYPVLIGDRSVLLQRANRLGIPFTFYSMPVKEKTSPAKGPVIFNVANLKAKVKIGTLHPSYGKAAGEYLEKALELALNGAIDAIVTAPINKEAFNLAGYDYAGHTEFFAKRTNTEEYAMMFVYDCFRVVLLSTHLSLQDAIKKVKKENIIRLINLLKKEMWKFGLVNARIAVAGLNPHCSERGLFGNEEEKEIIPAIKECQKNGIKVEGPFPADTLFTQRVRSRFDVILSLYHDQGLIPIKMVASKGAVNVTLGLPIIRTSVDHGTAFDIAAKGIADASSLKEAIKLAVEMAKNVEHFGKKNA